MGFLSGILNVGLVEKYGLNLKYSAEAYNEVFPIDYFTITKFHELYHYLGENPPSFPHPIILDIGKSLLMLEVDGFEV